MQGLPEADSNEGSRPSLPDDLENIGSSQSLSKKEDHKRGAINTGASAEKPKFSEIQAVIAASPKSPSAEASGERNSWNQLRTKLLVEHVILIDNYLIALWLVIVVLTTFAYYFEDGIENNEKFEQISHLLLYLINILAILTALLNALRKMFLYRLTKYRGSKNVIKEWFELFLLQLPLETAIIMVNPLPFLMKSKQLNFSVMQFYETKLTYIDNDMLHLISNLKLFIFVRGMMTRTIFYSDRAYRVCQIFNFEMDYHFVIKCLMRKSPFIINACWLVTGILFFGHAVRITERPLRNATDRMDHGSYFSCVWEAFITMATVGYGDFYPRTNKGRFIMLLCGFYGVLNLSLTVVSVSNFLDMGMKEEKSYALILRVDLKKKMKSIASHIIGMFCFYANQQRKNRPVTYGTIKDFHDSCKQLEKLQFLYKKVGDSAKIEEKVANAFDMFLAELMELRKDTERLCSQMNLDPKAILEAELKGSKSPRSRQPSTVKVDNSDAMG